MRSAIASCLEEPPVVLPCHSRSETLWTPVAMAARALQGLLAAPVALFLLAFAVMLFRPPDLEFHSVDRIAFCVLVLAVLLRAMALRQSLRPKGKLAIPMAGLTFLAIASALSHPFEVGTWSVLAAKFLVPFTLFWLSGLVFREERDLRWLERFLLVVLAYLTFTAIAFLVGAHEFIFPRFILDASIGIHANRARGPFLQAVANGVTLNMLGLVAVECYRRERVGRIWLMLLLAALPLAIVATKTRGVWLAFSCSILWLMMRSGDRRLRGAAVGLAFTGLVGVLVVSGLGDTLALNDRLHENSPVEFRFAIYKAGWQMFLERPLAGWGTQQLQAELAERVEGFQGEVFAIHNTYLEMLVEHGILGLCLYLWLVVALFRLGRGHTDEVHSFVASIRFLWPLLLSVYLINAMLVVMNYQFVNGLLFTFAGILAWHSKPPSPQD